MGRQVHRFVLAGDRFGDWEVLDVNVPRNKYNRLMALCACRRCGGEPRLVLQYDLLRGVSTGDGCLKHQKLYGTRVVHASAPRDAKSQDYKTWLWLKRRYPEQLCAQWADSFECMMADLPPRPSPNHRIHVIDKDAPIMRLNVEWRIKRSTTIPRNVARAARRVAEAEARANASG